MFERMASLMGIARETGMSEKWTELPSGIKHLTMLMIASADVAHESAEHFDEFKINRSIIGTCLNVLYQAGTCYRKCHGGGHLLERLCGPSPSSCSDRTLRRISEPHQKSRRADES